MIKKLRRRLTKSEDGMGNGASAGLQNGGIVEETGQNLPKSDLLLTEITGGNCRAWSENVYSKLFLDSDNKSATLAVVKTEISYVDLFTDREHVLFRSRCIGGKNDSAAQMFVYDLMKTDWESRVPHVEAIELNVDIIMSSSPLSATSQSLLNLIRVEKELLKHKQFRGQLNVTIRFAHPYGWDAKDDMVREDIHQGLRELYAHGVNLGALDFQGILEEMRLDGLEELQDEQHIRNLIESRQNYLGNSVESHRVLNGFKYNSLLTPVSRSRGSPKALPIGVIEERARSPSRIGPALNSEDQYQVYMMNRLDNILEPDFEERGMPRPTSVARHVMSTTPKKCFDQVMNELRTNKNEPKDGRISESHSERASNKESEINNGVTVTVTDAEN